MQEHLAKVVNVPHHTSMFKLLKGSFENEDELLNFSVATKRPKLAGAIYYLRLFEAFWCRDYTAGMDLGYKFLALENFSSIEATSVHFYVGLMVFQLARENDTNEKFFDAGEVALETFRKWTSHSEWNYQNKMFLLEAENHFSRGERIEAKRKYELAIQSSHAHRFGHEEGLAYELFGYFYASAGDNTSALMQFLNARSCYERYGCNVKVSQLDKCVATIMQIQACSLSA